MGDEGKKDKKRRSGTSKALDLLLRCCHVGTSGVLFGGLVLSVPFVRLDAWHTLAIGSGAALVLAGICQSRHWPYQGRGLLALAHIGLLALVHYLHGQLLPLLAAGLAIGIIGSNMPGHWRHWSVIHRRRMD